MVSRERKSRSNVLEMQFTTADFHLRCCRISTSAAATQLLYCRTHVKSQTKLDRCSPARVVFLLNPGRALLERPHVLLEDPKLDAATAEAAAPRGDDYLALSLFGRSERNNLAVRLPLGDEKAVLSSYEDAHQVLITE